MSTIIKEIKGINVMKNSNSNSNSNDTVMEAAIIGLLILTGVMLLALFTRTAPHPPLEVPLFALAPFLGSGLAIGSAALILIRGEHSYAKVIVFLFCILSLISFGPQKYFDPSFSRIWPAVICAQACILLILIRYFFSKTSQP